VRSGIYKAMASESSIYYTSENKSIHNSTFSEWIEKWWSWWLGIPNDKHIVQKNNDGNLIYLQERCSINQNGPVWFLPDVLLELPGSHLEYTCEVPAGKDILIPITTTECDLGSEGGTDDELKKCANNFYDIDDPKNPTRITIEVDGNPIDPKNLKGQTGFFNVTIPENPPDIFGNIKYKNKREETYRAMASGYFLFLKPLTAGKTYKITFECEDHFLEFTALPISTRTGIFTININN
jgi:hypothetical protein